jgi:hypothetical protein
MDTQELQVGRMEEQLRQWGATLDDFASKWQQVADGQERGREGLR